MRVLDAGCGRGEMLLACAQRGAAVAGIDYSEAAIALADETLAGLPEVEVIRGEVTRLPWPEAAFDRALLGDVIEHLDTQQANAALRELCRVLRPGGRLVVHTAPNRLFLRVGWPLARAALRLLGRRETVASMDDWLSLAERYHVNEQSLRGLRRAVLEAGFDSVRAWIDPNVIRAGSHHLTSGLEQSRLTRAGARVAGAWPSRLVFGNDLYAVGVR